MNVLLISKDILMKDYLEPYGNDVKMPNISELAKKGTIFKRHYTAAPSTAMSFTSMFTGKYAYETNRKKYVEVEEYNGQTLFDIMYDNGFEVHTLWDSSYVHLAQKYSKCYGKHTNMHNVDWLTKKIPPHIKGKYDDLSYRDEFTIKLLDEFKRFIQQLMTSKNNIFLWIHFPHVLAGRNTYGSDLDVFDTIVGICREYFDDTNIFITADHGHMNGEHGKFGYGFDLYEPAINIPLITPRINNCSEIDFPTSNTQLIEIITKRQITKLPYVISETAYYEQPHRKIAIIKDSYKYMYEKQSKKHYIFDLKWDPHEFVNFSYPEIYDIDRKRYYAISQRIFYRKWDKILLVFNELDSIKKSIWKNPPFFKNVFETIKFRAKLFAAKLLKR